MKRAQYSAGMVFVAACFGMLLFGVTLITLGSVAPKIQSEFSLDGVASGLLFSILPFGILFGSLLFGPFADRFGYKLILLISCVMVYAGLQGIASSSSVNVLRLCVFFFGFGGGALNGSTNALVSDISEGNRRSANLSLLGVFFAAGALGVPLLLGMLEEYSATETILRWMSYFTLCCAGFFALVRFPRAKQSEGITLRKIGRLADDKLVSLIALFLVCQSGFEGIINNWTTLYLMNSSAVEMRLALFALSMYVVGMAVMRIVLGYVLRLVDQKVLLVFSMVLLMTGNLLFTLAPSYPFFVAGLILIGAGLAAGFPVMLGLIGSRYADISGTAFGLTISIALLGNMMINYAAGVIVENHGIDRITIVPFALTGFMLILVFLISRRSNNFQQTNNQ